MLVSPLVVTADLTQPKVEEQKEFQAQHGEKYIQLKNYADQLEAELQDAKARVQGLTTSNEELREVNTNSALLMQPNRYLVLTSDSPKGVQGKITEVPKLGENGMHPEL